MIIRVDTHYEDLFFTAAIIATKSIKLIANDARHAFTTGTFVYLVILGTNYS